MPNAHIDPRRAKIHHSYTVAEAAALWGVHRNTVRSWIKAGLATIRTQTGILILGEDLRRFLVERRAKRHQTCPPGHLFCFGCRRPRKPAPGSLDIVRYTANSGHAHGVCPCCGVRMNRRINILQLVEKGFGGAPVHARGLSPSR